MVNRVIKLIYSEVRDMHKVAFVIAFFTLGSQLLAFVRNRLLAHNFGAGYELDLYNAAFKIPDLLFALFSSVLSVYVLLPFVLKAREESGSKAAANTLGQMFTFFVYCYLAVTVVLFIFLPQILPIIFSDTMMEHKETLINLTRILLLQPYILGISSLFSVVTQISQKFVLYALCPILYNLGIIIGIVFFQPWLGLSGLVWGVVLGAAMHMVVQWPMVAKSPLSFGLVGKIDWLLLKSILTTAVPRAVTLSVNQIVLLALVIMMSKMTEGSITVFQFAFDLQSVPLTLIGMSYSVAAFPVLADLFAQKKQKIFNEHIYTAFRHIVFWSVPAMALILVLRAHIVRVVLGSGAFDWDDTKLTAAILALFVVALVAQALIMLLVRAFYAGGRTKTPLLIALFGASVTILSAPLFIKLYYAEEGFRHWLGMVFRLEGVAGTEVLTVVLAFVLGSLVQMGILLVVAVREFSLTLKGLGRRLIEAILAATAGGGVSYLALDFLKGGVNQETFIGIMLQGAVAGFFGLSVTILVYYLLGSEELREIYNSIRSRLARRKKKQ